MLNPKEEHFSDPNEVVQGNAEADNVEALGEDHTLLKKGRRISQHGLQKVKLERALEYINEHLSDDISILDIAVDLKMSQYHFSRLFKQSTGMTVHAYLVEQRVKKAMYLLQATELSILVIAEQCGFANPSHLARCFRKQVGIPPRQYRQRG